MLGAFGIARDVVAISPSELHSAEREGELVEIDGVPSWWRVEVGQRRWGSCAVPVLHEDPPSASPVRAAGRSRCRARRQDGHPVTHRAAHAPMPTSAIRTASSSLRNGLRA